MKVVGLFLNIKEEYIKIGELTHDENFSFKYEQSWLDQHYKIAGIEPEMKILPPWFTDRLPTKHHFYKMECEQLKIDLIETDIMILISTLGWNSNGSIVIIPLNFTTKIWEEELKEIRDNVV